MISLFEAQEGRRGAVMPVDLVAGGSRGVTMLEFFAIDEAKETREEEQPTSDEEVNAKAQQVRVMVDAARAEAHAAARDEFEEELAEAIALERERAAWVCAEFARDRQRYFAAAEAQVVQLALAVARRVLAREVAADAMHLAAIVRAALARVKDGSATVLRVKPAAVEAWSAMFASEGDDAVSVVGDDRLSEDECLLETEVGRVELGVAAQLEEIERGFDGLLHRQGA